VNSVAQHYAEAHSSYPYAGIVVLLDSGDLDVQTNALTFINVLLQKAPDPRQRKQLVLNLEHVGVFDILRVCACGCVCRVRLRVCVCVCRVRVCVCVHQCGACAEARRDSTR